MSATPAKTTPYKTRRTAKHTSPVASFSSKSSSPGENITRATLLANLVANNDWRNIVEKWLKAKDDYKLRYYFTGQTQQVDRDWVAQAASYYNGRTKRQECPVAATVTQQLPNFVQGYTQNLDEVLAPIVTFKTAKHVLAFMEYVHANRNAHNNINVHVSLDDSPYFEVL